MAVTISRPRVSRRPWLLDNGKQRLNPENDRPLWIPQVCVTLTSDAAPARDVCVTIYKKVRRNGRLRLEKVCDTKKVTLQPPRVGAFGSMSLPQEVCCDLRLDDGVRYVPDPGTEFVAAWDPAPAPPAPCPDVPVRRDNRSRTLRVREYLDLYAYSGRKITHSALIGVGMEAMEVGRAEVQVAANLPIGWSLDLPEAQPEVFPAAVVFTIAARPGASIGENAKITFQVVDETKEVLDEVGYQVAALPDPDLPYVEDEEEICLI